MDLQTQTIHIGNKNRGKAIENCKLEKDMLQPRSPRQKAVFMSFSSQERQIFESTTVS